MMAASLVPKELSLQDLPTELIVEGYYWYSDQVKPEIVRGQQIEAGWFTDLPFVVEANFFAPEDQISIQVKSIDGNYLIHQFDLKELPDEHMEEEWYRAHDLPGVDSFRVVEAWKLEADPLLEGLSSWVPAWRAFGGFNKKK